MALENMNDMVVVKLTSHGLRTLNSFYRPGIAGPIPGLSADGTFESPLWHLFQVFGPEIHQGQIDMPFEGNAISLKAT